MGPTRINTILQSAFFKLADIIPEEQAIDLMKAPFDRPYKFSLIFTYEEQVKFVKIINNIKNNALVT